MAAAQDEGERWRLGLEAVQEAVRLDALGELTGARAAYEVGVAALLDYASRARRHVPPQLLAALHARLATYVARLEEIAASEALGVDAAPCAAAEDAAPCAAAEDTAPCAAAEDTAPCAAAEDTARAEAAHELAAAAEIGQRLGAPPIAADELAQLERELQAMGF